MSIETKQWENSYESPDSMITIRIVTTYSHETRDIKSFESKAAEVKFLL